MRGGQRDDPKIVELLSTFRTLVHRDEMMVSKSPASRR